jgi:hypothetical protein
MTHPCAIPGCERPAKDQQLMCWPHWRRVPRALNWAVFDTYRAMSGGGIEAVRNYQQARDAAIAAVVEKEANP